MTKDVLISISGIHIDVLEQGETPDEPIEVITPASYFFKNGKHYILYDEVAEGMPGVTKNKVKITGDKSLEIMKSGLTSAHMVFEKDQTHLTNYKTPFGQLLMGIHTTSLDITEEENQISASIKYQLEVDNQAIADCRIRMTIKSKTEGITI